MRKCNEIWKLLRAYHLFLHHGHGAYTVRAWRQTRIFTSLQAMQFTEIYLTWRTGSRLWMPYWDARKRSRIYGLGGTHQSAFYIGPTWLSHSELTVTNIHHWSFIDYCDWNFFLKWLRHGGPTEPGAPCHGIIGILVNPALPLRSDCSESPAQVLFTSLEWETSVRKPVLISLSFENELKHLEDHVQTVNQPK